MFASGLEIDGGEICLPAKVCGISHDRHFAFVGLDEGKYHQVKRMFQAAGNKVLSLFRVQIGGLVIDGNLAPGECLEVFNNDVEKMLFDYESFKKQVVDDMRTAKKEITFFSAANAFDSFYQYYDLLSKLHWNGIRIHFVVNDKTICT